MGGEWYLKEFLKNVAKLIMGQSPPGSTYNEFGEGVPFYQGVRDFGERYPTRRVYCTAPTRFAKADDVLFSVRAPIGEINRATEDCSIGRGLAAIRADSYLDTTYIEYVLRYIRREWEILEGQGAVFGNAKKSDLENLPVPWPKDEKRRAIARILGSLDDKIELNRKTNETLEAMARAIFKSWFVDFDPVRAKADLSAVASAKAEGRDPLSACNAQAGGLPDEIAALFPDNFQDSDLGEIPKGWKVSTIGSEFNLTMGQSPPGKTYNENGDGLPFFQGRRDFGFRFPTNRVYCTAPKRLADHGDTLVSVRAPVGDINMAMARCCVGRGVAGIRHKSESRSYTYYAMHTLGDRFARFEAEGTVFGAINKKQFEGLRWLSPPGELVNDFEKIAFSLDERIENNTNQTVTLSSLRNTILPKLISGELRIPDAGKLLESVI